MKIMKESSGHIIFSSVAAMILLVMAAVSASCTKNNGDIGVWFGQWRVEKIEIDGVENSDYAGNLFFSFQNAVFEEKIVTPEHEAIAAYGRWTENADGTLNIYMEEPDYPPIDGYMVKDLNVMNYEIKSSTTITLTLKTADEHSVAFHLLKW